MYFCDLCGEPVPEDETCPCMELDDENIYYDDEYDAGEEIKSFFG